MAKKEKIKPQIINRFADGKVIYGPIKPGQVAIPEGHKFYDVYAEIIRKYGP